MEILPAILVGQLPAVDQGVGAQRLPGQLPDDVRQERLSRLIALQRDISAASNRRDIGRSFEVLRGYKRGSPLSD